MLFKARTFQSDQNYGLSVLLADLFAKIRGTKM
jgi:hypothetical protein